jgi:hypothetical protein
MQFLTSIINLPIYEKTDKSCTSSELPVFPLVSKSLEPAEGGKGGARGEGAGKPALIIFHHIVLTQASAAKENVTGYGTVPTVI